MAEPPQSLARPPLCTFNLSFFGMNGTWLGLTRLECAGRTYVDCTLRNADYVVVNCNGGSEFPTVACGSDRRFVPRESLECGDEMV